MYKIKSKLVDGKVMCGIIDENLTELVEFKYKEILPVEGNSKVFLLKSENNKMSVFMDNMIINTKYKELTFIPSKICGYSDMYMGKTSKKTELIFIRKKYMEEKLEINVFKPTEIFGKDSIVKIDDIKIEEDGVCLYSNTEEGLLKGYLGHKILGNFKPEYIDVKSYSYVSSKPYIPKDSTTRFEEDWESRYAIVTKRVNGQLKMGIVIRKKGEYDDEWEELIPPKYDDIIPHNNGDFLTINYKNGKPQKGLIHMTTYYGMWSKGACIYGCARLKEEFEIKPEFDEIKRLAEINTEYIGESDYIYYIVKKNNKYGLYKSKTMEARGTYDYCDHQRPDVPFLEKMLDCEYDSIEAMVSRLGLKNYMRRRFVESFRATKGEESLLVFDRKDANDDYVKTECKYKDIQIDSYDYNRTFYILKDGEGFKQFVNFEAIPENDVWKATKYQLKSTPKYKEAYITKTKSCTYLLIGKYDNGKVDVFDQYMEQKCDHVDEFKKEDYFCISKKEIEYEESVVKSLSVYNKLCEFIHEFTGSEIAYSYSDKTYSVYVNVDGKIYIVDLIHNKVIDGKFTYIEINEDFMIYEQESGCGLNRLTKDGLVNILEPIYKSIQILFDINRIIVEKKNKDGIIKYGVIEANKGNSCLDIIYDSIICDTDKFDCTLGDQNLYFDFDGFVIEDQVVLKRSK